MFSEEKIDDLADKLLIGLTREENKMIRDEFEEIENKFNSLGEIDGLKDVEPQSYPYEMILDDICDYSTHEISALEALSNCKNIEGREVEIPKVVG